MDGEGVVEAGEVYRIDHETKRGSVSFYFRHLSMRYQKRAMLAYDAWLDGKKTTDECYSQTMEFFRFAVVNWENARDLVTNEPVPFNLDDIDLIVDCVDARGLLLKTLRNGRPAPAEKKD
jgi:hypothetical protein